MLTGNCVALLTPFIIVPILTFIFKPQNFDWKLLDQRITRVDEEEELAEALGGTVSSDPERLHPIKSQISVIASQLVEGEKRTISKGKRDFEQIFQDLLYCLLYTRYLSCGSFPNAIIWNQIYFL